jgi:hypothetical protein
MAILNLLLLAVAIAVHVVWIISLVNYDGKCHIDDCGHCPYEGDCPMEEEHETDTGRET